MLKMINELAKMQKIVEDNIAIKNKEMINKSLVELLHTKSPSKAMLDKIKKECEVETIEQIMLNWDWSVLIRWKFAKWSVWEKNKYCLLSIRYFDEQA